MSVEYIVERGVRILPASSWQPVLQQSIDAYYAGRMIEGRDACLLLLSDPGVPRDVRELTYRNQSFYAQALADMVQGAGWVTLIVPGLDGETACEPSLALTGDRIVALLRYGSSASAGSPAHVLLTLDEEFHVADVAVLDDETGEAPRFTEVRPFFTDRLQAAVIVRPADEGGHCLAAVVDAEAGVWRHIRNFGPRAGDFQQGWSPVLTVNGVHVVAWWEPTEVFRLTEENDNFERIALRMAPHVAERFEGGSQGVAVPGGYLFLVNERVRFDDDPPLVFSRFVRLDESFQIDAISPQFFVADRGRDAASGLARRGDRLIAGFSSGDQRALLATCDVESVLATLIPVDAPGKRRSTMPS